MEIKYEVTKEDYIKFNLYHAQNSPYNKKILALSRYGIPVIFLPIIYFIGTKLFEQSDIYWVIIDILFSIIWIVSYPQQHKLFLEKVTEKLINEGDNSELLGAKNMIIDDETITIHNKSSFEKISKTAIKDVKIYDDLIVVYTSGITAHIVPTRSLDEKSKDNLIKKVINM